MDFNENYKGAYNVEHIRTYLREHNSKIIAFDIETAPSQNYRYEPMASLDPHKAHIVGISLSCKIGTGIYIPLRHENGPNAEDIQCVLSYLKEYILENSTITKVAHNIAFESAFVYGEGVVIQPPVYDTIIASQLTLKNENEFRNLKDSGLKTLSKKFFNKQMETFAQITENMHFDSLNSHCKRTLEYACGDSDYALRLYYLFEEWFKQYIPKHSYICREVDSPAAVYSGIMKFNGMRVNRDLMEQQLHLTNYKLSLLRERVREYTNGVEIGKNASTKELKNYIYINLKLPILKRTEKGEPCISDEAIIALKDYCTQKEDKLRAEHEEGSTKEIIRWNGIKEFLSTIQEYRMWGKIKSTYIEGMIKHVNGVTNSIHCDLNPLGTETGRFSSRNPNLQNLYRKDNDPIGVRNFFVARDGCRYFSFDFSQIELRVGGFFTGDKEMRRVYDADGDIHGVTTSLIYNISLEEALDKNNSRYKERRTIAKNCNFGIFFGLYPRGLQNTLRYKAGIYKSEDECKWIVDSIKRGYGSISIWQERVKSASRYRGYSETYLGRRRILKDMYSTDWSKRGYSERCALNTPIQGTAADIIKIAMGNILKEIKERNYIKPVLQIHDELVFEVREDKLQESMEIIREIMERRPFDGFDIPIKVEGSMGKSFGEL